MPAIELAQEMVNRNSTLLSNYTLTHTGVLDTKVRYLMSRVLVAIAVDLLDNQCV